MFTPCSLVHSPSIINDIPHSVSYPCTILRSHYFSKVYDPRVHILARRYIKRFIIIVDSYLFIVLDNSFVDGDSFVDL